MSVITESDEIIEDIKYNLDKTIKEMVKLIFDDVWGWDDYNKEYQEKMLEYLVELKKIRKGM